ncbi:alpha-1,2-fucosyltransferase [Mucilaginibacter calamicampi]|uniref:Alpha-1,2-fucosyltransferase n=1 Tax=Mucilaginibacter calamicampi TaxID=1302352 RepID=A0ABW2YSA1_9SPHI
MEKGSMIVVKLQGGLGNQLFQYAFGTALAEKYRDTLKFDLGSYEVGASRKLDILEFRVDLRAVDEAQYNDFFSLKNRMLKKLKLSVLATSQVHFENSATYYDVHHSASKNIFYFGYWQSPRYFEAVSKIIHEQFKLRNDNLPLFYRDLLKQNQTVAIHIRRGDYLLAGNAQVHGNLPQEYYERAVDLMQQSVGDSHYLIFSDDLSWVKDNFKIPVKWQMVDDCELNAAQTLALMAACNHQIIANSTFSWWAAWLNTNPQKKVIAPKNWFANGRDATELLMNSWTAL